MVDQRDLDALAAAVRDDTTSSGWRRRPIPTLNVIDLAGVIERKRGALVAVDNTFATPVHQRPLELGADVVVHSTTKYLGGHSDAVGGAAIVRDPALHEQVRFVQNAVGAVPGPFDCFLVHRGLRTLHLRVAAHDANGLRGRRPGSTEQAGVEDVRWPGFGGMVSFRHPDAIRIASRHAGLLAGRVAGRRRVADRGAAGDDAPVGRGLRRGGAGRPRAPVVRDRGERRPHRGPGASASALSFEPRAAPRARRGRAR